MPKEFEIPEKLFVQLALAADGSLRIRKWSQFPFDGATDYAAAPQPAHGTSAKERDTPAPADLMPTAARIADAIELCDWSGCSIGNKEILKSAVAALRLPTPPDDAQQLRSALIPFATDADIYDDQGIDDGEKSFKDNLTVGDLRRARSALLGPPAPAENAVTAGQGVEAECVIDQLRELYDQTPLLHVSYPAADPIDTPSWGKGLNSGWDAAIREAVRIVSSALSTPTPKEVSK